MSKAIQGAADTAIMQSEAFEKQHLKSSRRRATFVQSVSWFDARGNASLSMHLQQTSSRVWIRTLGQCACGIMTVPDTTTAWQHCQETEISALTRCIQQNENTMSRKGLLVWG